MTDVNGNPNSFKVFLVDPVRHLVPEQPVALASEYAGTYIAIDIAA